MVCTVGTDPTVSIVRFALCGVVPVYYSSVDLDSTLFRSQQNSVDMMSTDASYAGLKLELREHSFEACQVCRDSLTAR